MKNLRVFTASTVFLLTTSVVVYAQERLDIASFSLSSPTKPTLILASGQTSTECKQIFGQPSQIKHYYAEMEGDSIIAYFYGSNELLFLRDRLIGYELDNSSIIVGKADSLHFKIGDTINSINKAFKQTSTNRTSAPVNLLIRYEPGESRGRTYQAIGIIYLQKNSTSIDSRCELLFDKQNKIIHIALLD